ncbi:MAG: glycosyltransferase [Candidatus Omnitrophica bacterium]|nr:glycosyltransferase [Candidatus Omnitrophota bacterium]
MDLSIVIPIRNEAAAIEALQGSLVEVLSQLNLSSEVILCDDDSTDGSNYLIRTACKEDSRFRLHSMSKHSGQMATLTEGLMIAQGSLLMTLDADLQIHPREIPRFVEKIKSGCDFVNGHRTSRAKRSRPRKLASRLTARYLDLLSGQSHVDWGCGMTAFTRECWGRALETINGKTLTKFDLIASAKCVGCVDVVEEARQTGSSKYMPLQGCKTLIWYACRATSSRLRKVFKKPA